MSDINLNDSKCFQNNLEVNHDTKSKNKETDFKAQFAEIARIQKQKHKQHRRSQGLPTSSDEEDTAAKKLVYTFIVKNMN